MIKFYYQIEIPQNGNGEKMRTCFYKEDFDYPEIKSHFHLYNRDFQELHDHDYWEFFIILSGKTEHITGNQKQILKKGTGCLVHPWDKHYFIMKSSDYQQLNLAITEDYFHELFNIISPKLYEQLVSVNQPILYELTENELYEFQENIHFIQTSNGNKEKYGTLMKIIWLDIAKTIYRNDLHVNYDYPKWLNDFISIIHRPENIASPVSELSKLTFYSYRHLTRLFQQYTGESLNSYMLNIKMNYAALLLRSTDMGILNISSFVGYDSLSHFIRMFKKHFKTTPKQYRNLFKYHQQE